MEEYEVHPTSPGTGCTFPAMLHHLGWADGDDHCKGCGINPVLPKAVQYGTFVV